MGLKSEKILGISVTLSSKEEILEYLKKYLNSDRKTHPSSRISHHDALVIVTPNPEQVVLAQEDKYFAQILNQADVALPDGIGLVLAAKIFGLPHSPITHHSSLVRIPGVEFMEELVRLAAKRGYPIGLIGGRGKIAVEALECLRRKYPGLTGWTQELGELPILPISNTTNDQYYQYTQDIIDKIRSTKIKLVFVGLGAPKQEYFIEKLKVESLKLKVTAPLALMSVGGSFDLIAGRTRRAPSFVRSMGLEWLWRLVREPWRFGRQLRLLQFLWLICTRGRA